MITAFFGSAGRAIAPAVQVSSDSRDSRENIGVESLSATQWRVCDRRWPEHDARSLLGFIEMKEDDLFEVMQLNQGFEWFSFTSLAEATEHFTTVQASLTPDNENILSRLRAHA